MGAPGHRHPPGCHEGNFWQARVPHVAANQGALFDGTAGLRSAHVKTLSSSGVLFVAELGKVRKHMMKTNLVAFGLALVAMVGCASEATPTPAKDLNLPGLEGQRDAALRSFESRSVADRKAIYQTLSVAERAQLWEQQLDRILASEKLTNTERDELRNIRSNVKSVLEGNVAAMGQRLERTFGAERAAQFFGALGNPSSAKNTLVPQNVPPDGACDQRWNCGGMSCSLGSCTCWSCLHGCTATSSGCGWWWSESCTGTNSAGGSCD